MERRAREVHIQQALMWRKGKGSTGPRPGQLLPHLAPHQLLALPQAQLPPAPPPDSYVNATAATLPLARVGQP